MLNFVPSSFMQTAGLACVSVVLLVAAACGDSDSDSNGVPDAASSVAADAATGEPDGSTGACARLTDADVNGGVTLPAGCYVVEDDLTVDDGILALEAGVEIDFASNIGLTITGEGSLYADASGGDTIVVQGTENATGSRDFWKGIRFDGSFNNTNELNNVHLIDGGATSWISITDPSVIFLTGTSYLEVTDTTISNSNSYGIEASNNSVLAGCSGLEFEGIEAEDQIFTNRSNEDNICDGDWFAED